jgi:hypothetical protein
MTELHSLDDELPVAIIGLPIPEPNTFFAMTPFDASYH